MIIIDNHLYSFGYDLCNGVLVVPFYDDMNDD